MQSKQVNFNKYWHSDEWIDKNVSVKKEFNYLQKPIHLIPFIGTHPQVMKERIRSKNWKFEYDASMHPMSLKDKIKNFAQQQLGLNFNYKNDKRMHQLVLREAFHHFFYGTLVHLYRNRLIYHS